MFDQIHIEQTDSNTIPYHKGVNSNQICKHLLSKSQIIINTTFIITIEKHYNIKIYEYNPCSSLTTEFISYR